MEFLSKLWLGRLGLAKTYWIYNLLIPILLSIPIKLWSGEPSFFPFAYLCLLSIYSYVALIGLWRSSDLYKGNQVWNWLAKAVSVIGLLSQLLVALAVFGFGMRYLIGYVAVVGFVMWAFYGEYKVEKAEPSQNQASPTTTASKIEIDENLIWADVAKEFESNRNEGLWTKCFVESGGDENKAKVKYLAVRFEEMLALTKVIETPAPILKEVADLAQAQNNQAEPLNLTDDAQVIPTQASSNNEAVAKENPALYILIGIALLAGCSIFAIFVSNFSKPNSTQSQTQSSSLPQSSISTPLLTGHNWMIWDRHYYKGKVTSITYVDTNSIKKVGFLKSAYQVQFAEEMDTDKRNDGLDFSFIGYDKNRNEYPIKTFIFEAEYDCDNSTEKIISNRSFATPLNSKSPYELSFTDFELGKEKIIDPNGGSLIGYSVFRKLCSR
jgi:hypothetical protein